MPERTTRQKIDELLAKYECRYPNMAESKLIANVVCDLADFFGVSKQSAKLRMIELGYSAAQGVLNFANGAYVDNYSFTPGSISKNQTFTIDFDAAFDLCAANETFRKQLSSGRYQYVDGHFCLSNNRYLYRRNGKLHLTAYAKAHMNECCLVFTMQRGGYTFLYREGTLQKQATAAKPHPVYADAQAESADLWIEAQRLADVVDNLPGSPCATLKEHMKCRKVTIEGLVAKSGVSERTIKRLRTDRNYKPAPESAIAICIGLQLEPALSSDWLQKAGVMLTNSAEDIFYRMLLYTMYRQPVSAVNEILESHGFSALSKGKEELDE